VSAQLSVRGSNLVDNLPVGVSPRGFGSARMGYSRAEGED